MDNKVLVTGATGLLGRQILSAFREGGWQVVGVGFSRANPPLIQKIDLQDQVAVQDLLDQEKPHIVVHAAANRFPDKCDANPEGAKAINVVATRFLARATAARKIILIYISTDYVFAGQEGEAPYETDAVTEPTNLYGQLKLDGEEATIKEAGNLGVVLRVPVLYGSVTQNAESAINVLVDSVWKAQVKGVNISMDDWALRFPTNTEDVGRVCKDVALKYLKHDTSTLPRILQFSSKDCFTKFEICKMIADILGLPIEGISANKQGNDPESKTQRSFNTQLSTKSLESIGIPTWTQDFRAWW